MAFLAPQGPAVVARGAAGRSPASPWMAPPVIQPPPQMGRTEPAFAGTGTKGRRDGGTKGRRDEGTKGRRDIGTKAHTRTQGRARVAPQRPCRFRRVGRVTPQALHAAGLEDSACRTGYRAGISPYGLLGPAGASGCSQGRRRAQPGKPLDGAAGDSAPAPNGADGARIRSDAAGPAVAERPERACAANGRPRRLGLPYPSRRGTIDHEWSPRYVRQRREPWVLAGR
jgi:hypothetical protein